MKQYCIVGALDLAGGDTGGQQVKTRELYHAMCDKYGTEHIRVVETHQWKKYIFRTLFQLLRNVPTSDRIIMLPANNGLLVFSWLLRILKNKEAKLFYDVIGGWLADILSDNPKLLKQLKKLNGIWVETSSMKRDLQAMGLQNIVTVPNFKKLEIVNSEQLPIHTSAPYRLCTFSRVMEEKGITDAILAVAQVNAQLGEQIYTLDVYGPIASQYAEEFQRLQEENVGFVSYMGIADPSDSVRILKDYFALLFPSKFYTEGVPGTIIDAYAAGVPVITVRWLNCGDVLEEGKTGIGYEFGDNQALADILVKVAGDVHPLLQMKENCLAKAKQFMPGVCMEQITKLLEM